LLSNGGSISWAGSGVCLLRSLVDIELDVQPVWNLGVVLYIKRVITWVHWYFKKLKNLKRESLTRMSADTPVATPTSQTLEKPPTSASKEEKKSSRPAPRINVEVLMAQMQSLLGEPLWNKYTRKVASFVTGKLSRSELVSMS
jgi:hypothetical protein